MGNKTTSLNQSKVESQNNTHIQFIPEPASAHNQDHTHSLSSTLSKNQAIKIAKHPLSSFPHTISCQQAAHVPPSTEGKSLLQVFSSPNFCHASRSLRLLPWNRLHTVVKCLASTIGSTFITTPLPKPPRRTFISTFPPHMFLSATGMGDWLQDHITLYSASRG